METGDLVPGEVKQCNTCGEFLPYEDFHKDRTQKDGFKNACKDCRSKIQKRTRNQSSRQTTLEGNLETEARSRAIKRLIQNHNHEFRQLLVRYRREVGIRPEWMELR